MSKNCNICLIVLTFNEEAHIQRCLESVREIVNKIIIIDSNSTDNTCAIAVANGAEIIKHPWEGNQAKQFNWALENIEISSDWILRLDADEYITCELAKEIVEKIPHMTEDITGILLRRRVYFLGKWIKFGGYYPINLLRLWRINTGRFEDRSMDEHLILEGGKTVNFSYDFIDENLNNISWWIEKHNNYATREATELLMFKHYGNMSQKRKLSGNQELIKRYLKNNFYTKLPLFIRPFLYFIFRYFILFGFLDGKNGMIWHFLQGFWYRFLVDVKVYQMERISQNENIKIFDVFKKYY